MLVRENMAKIINHMVGITAFVMSEIPAAVIRRPELFENSRLVVAPNTTLFLYNETHGREIHDNIDRRIGFRWKS